MTKRAKQCAYWWERRTDGRRYVNARGQCKRTTAHPSGYCNDHKYMRKLVRDFAGNYPYADEETPR